MAEYQEMLAVNKATHPNDDESYIHIGSDGADVEGMKEDVSLQNRGFGTMIAKGVKGVGAVGSAVGSGLVGFFSGKSETQSPEGTALAVESDQPQGTKQEQQITQDLAEALRTVDELYQHNGRLNRRISEMVKDNKTKEKEIQDKEEELVDLRSQIDQVPQSQDDQFLELKAEIASKDSLIDDKQAHIKKLCEGKGDTSYKLATSLGTKEKELEQNKRDLNLERARVRASKSQIADLRKQLQEAEKYEKKHNESLKECQKLELEVERLEVELKRKNGEPSASAQVDSDSSVQTDLNEKDAGDEPFTLLGCDEATKSSLREKNRKISFLEKELAVCQQRLTQKETENMNFDAQLKEARAAALEVMKVKDHARGQSRQIMHVKQELDATMMSHEQLAQHVASLEHQVEDTEGYSRKLEQDLRKLTGAQKDKTVLEQALTDTKRDYEAKLKKEQDTISDLVAIRSTLEVQLFQEKKSKDELTKEFEELQDQLGIAKTEAELYKEDFEQERKDREKAHNMKEEMRLECDKALHEKTIEFEELRLASEETIERLRMKVEDTSEDRDQIKEEQEARATRSTTKQHQLRTQVQQYQENLSATRKQLFEAQQEIQAKTAQVKQYKKKDDQREEKLNNLEARNKELVQEMERVRQEVEKAKKDADKAKKECESIIDEERKTMGKEMERVRNELVKEKKKVDSLTKTKRMSKGDMQEELVVLQLKNQSLQEDYDKLEKAHEELQEQFTRMKQFHIALKERQKSSSSLTSPTDERVGTKATPHPTPAPTQANVQRNVTKELQMQSNNEEATTGGTGSLCHNQPPLRAVDPGTPGTPVSVAATNYNPQGQSSASTPTDVCTDCCKHAGSSGQDQGLQAFSEPPRPRVLDQGVDAHPGNYQQPQNGVFNQGGSQWNGQQFPQQQVYANGQSVPRGYHSSPIPQSQQRSNDLNQGSSGPIVYQPEQNFLEPSYNTQGRPETHYPQSRNNFQEDPVPYEAIASNQQVQYHRANVPSTYPHGARGYQQQYYDEGGNIGVDYQRQQDREYYYQQQQQNQQGQYYGGENAHSNYDKQQGSDYNHQRQQQQQRVDSQANQQQQQLVELNTQYETDPTQPPDQQPSSAHPVPRPRTITPKASTNSNTGGNQPSPLISSQPAISNPPSSRLDPSFEPPQQPPVRAPEKVAKDTRQFVHDNDLEKGIDQDMEQAAAEVTAETTEEGTREDAPFDPNLVCPMCMKQYRIGEIQLFRAHVGKCDGTT